MILKILFFAVIIINFCYSCYFINKDEADKGIYYVLSAIFFVLLCKI